MHVIEFVCICVTSYVVVSSPQSETEHSPRRGHRLVIESIRVHLIDPQK